MKTSKALSIIIILVAAFSFACNSLLKSYPVATLSSQQVDLVSLLPASDIVVKINSKRLFDDSIPQLLSFAPEQAAKFNAQMDELRSKNGIDPRAFDQIVVGWTYKSAKPTDVNDVDFVAIARGNFDAAALLETSKTASKEQVREETISGKTVYIYDAPTASDKQNALGEGSEKNNFADEAIAKRFKVDQVAMVSLDSNTVAFAKPLQIRSLLSDNKTSVNPALVELLNRNPNVALNFAMSSSFYQSLVSSGIGKGSTAEAPKMREALASLDFDSNGFFLNLTAIAPQEDDAKKLEESFIKMQSSAKQMLSSASDETSQITARAVDNFKITRNATEVQFQANVPKNDFEKMMKSYVALLGSMFAAGVSESKKSADLSPSVTLKKPLPNNH